MECVARPGAGKRGRHPPGRRHLYATTHLPPSMTTRAGFTLIELMVATVVTGLVTSLAYAAVSAGFDTSDRIEQYHTTVEAQAIVRELLLDALRHPTEQGGAAMNDVLFAL